MKKREKWEVKLKTEALTLRVCMFSPCERRFSCCTEEFQVMSWSVNGCLSFMCSCGMLTYCPGWTLPSLDDCLDWLQPPLRPWTRLNWASPREWHMPEPTQPCLSEYVSKLLSFGCPSVSSILSHVHPGHFQFKAQRLELCHHQLSLLSLMDRRHLQNSRRSRIHFLFLYSNGYLSVTHWQWHSSFCGPSWSTVACSPHVLNLHCRPSTWRLSSTLFGFSPQICELHSSLNTALTSSVCSSLLKRTQRCVPNPPTLFWTHQSFWSHTSSLSECPALPQTCLLVCPAWAFHAVFLRDFKCLGIVAQTTGQIQVDPWRSFFFYAVHAFKIKLLPHINQMKHLLLPVKYDINLDK